MKISVITPTIRCAGLSIIQKCLAEQTFKSFEWLVEVGLKNRHDLNEAFNKMLRRAKGEFVVFLEDYTKVPPNYLQKWWDAYQKHPTTFFTAPLGKSASLEFTPPFKWDWRADQLKAGTNDFVDSTWQCWEIDNGAAPLALLKQIGGFDEELDKAWSCDNLNTGCRADIAGFKFKNYFSNPAVAYDHDAFIPHPFSKNWNPNINNERMEQFRHGLTLPPLA